ncbi:MAG: transcriptional repressor [Treponemataceae bacterium]|nr:transcriptional repressor [Treponemataceae bacterium]
MQKIVYKTKQQDLILNYLGQMQGKHFTAEEVYRHFAESGVSVGIATVYRQLEKLVTDGKIQKYFIDDKSPACFEYLGEDCLNSHEHFHLKCESCGKLIHLECDELSGIENHLKEDHGFTVNPLRTVLYGICAECAAKEKGENA